jgi:hypothetical protein
MYKILPLQIKIHTMKINTRQSFALMIIMTFYDQNIIIRGKHFFFSLDFKGEEMRLFVCVAFLVGLVSCGDFMLESQSDMFGKWAKYKAMETCFGDEVRILY